jgi:hypothetical protein
MGGFVLLLGGPLEGPPCPSIIPQDGSLILLGRGWRNIVYSHSSQGRMAYVWCAVGANETHKGLSILISQLSSALESRKQFVGVTKSALGL